MSITNKKNLWICYDWNRFLFGWFWRFTEKWWKNPNWNRLPSRNKYVNNWRVLHETSSWLRSMVWTNMLDSGWNTTRTHIYFIALLKVQHLIIKTPFFALLKFGQSAILLPSHSMEKWTWPQRLQWETRTMFAYDTFLLAIFWW